MSTIIIKVPRSKVEEMSETASKMLRYGGKLMQCLEDMQDEDEMGERNMNYRYPMGMRGRMGHRDEEDEDDDEMGERRRRNSRGRYM